MIISEATEKKPKAAPQPSLQERITHNVFKPLVRGTEKLLFPEDYGDYAWRRRFLHNLLAPIFKGEFNMPDEDRQRFQELEGQDYGFVFAFNHFGRKDPFEVAARNSYSTNRSEGLTRKKDVSPISKHVNSTIAPELVPWFFRQLGSAVIPITTEHDIDIAVTKAKKKGSISLQDEKTIRANERKKGGGIARFMEATRIAVAEGGSSYVAPTTTRKDHLEKHATARTMSTLAYKLEQSGITNVGYVVVGLGIKGAENYSKSKVGGFNLLKHHVSNARVYTLEQIKDEIRANDPSVVFDLTKPTSYRPIDEWFNDRLKELVPPEYLVKPPEVRKKRIPPRELGRRAVNLVKGKFMNLAA